MPGEEPGRAVRLEPRDADVPAQIGVQRLLLGAASQHDPTGVTRLLPNPGGLRYYGVAGPVPHKDATNYQLTVNGLVDRPMRYTLPGGE